MTLKYDRGQDDDESRLKALQSKHTALQEKYDRLKYAAEKLTIRCNGISVYGRNPYAYPGASNDLIEMINKMYDYQCLVEEALKDET